MTVSSDPILNQVMMSEMPVNMTLMPALPWKTDYRGNRRNFNNQRQKNLWSDGFMTRRITANQKNQNPNPPQQAVAPMPQRLPYPCEIELKGNSKPYVAKPYPLKDSARQKAIRDLLQNLWDWHAIEKGEASWKSLLLTIMNRVTENQKQNKGYTPTYRVVQDVRQLNLHIKDVEFRCPRIPSILNSVKGRPVISVLDFTKAYFHMKNTQKTKDYCGIAGTPYVWNSMPLGIKTAPASGCVTCMMELKICDRTLS